MRTPFILKPLAAFVGMTLGIAFGTVGCSTTEPGNADVGGVRLALDAAPGITISSVSYSITGPASFTRMGAIDTSNSATLSSVIGGLPSPTTARSTCTSIRRGSIPCGAFF